MLSSFNIPLTSIIGPTLKYFKPMPRFHFFSINKLNFLIFCFKSQFLVGCQMVKTGWGLTDPLLVVNGHMYGHLLAVHLQTGHQGETRLSGLQGDIHLTGRLPVIPLTFRTVGSFGILLPGTIFVFSYRN